MKTTYLPSFLLPSLLIASCLLWFSFKTDNQSGVSLKEINDLSYYESDEGTSEHTKLNLIIPEGVENPPVLMWIGGGAWAYVDRQKEMDLCRAMARQGVLMISVGHRLSPALLMEPKNPEGIKHPEHVKDIAQAFKWVYQHAAEYGYSAKNISVGGYSSGAHLAALLAADGKYLEQVGLSTDMIKSIVPVAGGYDIPHYSKAMFKEDPAQIENHINPVFGETHEEHVDASPITYIDDFKTPMLLVSESYTYEFTTIFEQALKEKGYTNYQVLHCHNENHNSLWKKLSWQKNCIYRNYMVDYLQSLNE